MINGEAARNASEKDTDDDDDDKQLAYTLFILAGVATILAITTFAVTPICLPAAREKNMRLPDEFRRRQDDIESSGFDAPELNKFSSQIIETQNTDFSDSDSYGPEYGSYVSVDNPQSSSNTQYGNSFGSGSSSYESLFDSNASDIGETSLTASSSYYSPGSSSSSGDPANSYFSPSFSAGISNYPSKSGGNGDKAGKSLKINSMEPTHSTDTSRIPEDWWTVTNYSCGVQAIQPAGRIVGGSVATPHSWPWAVNLLKSAGEYFFPVCGGTIVSPRHVISALHCVDMTVTDLAAVHRIAVGKHDNIDDPGTQEEVAKIRAHPFGRADKKGVYYDLILITLKKELTFSDNVQPACLPPLDEELSSGRMCWAYGWGNTQSSGGDGNLKQVELEIGNETECYSTWKVSGLNKEYAICAGKRVGHDTCQGDSGGPLTCQDNGKWVLYGATSWGGDCGAGRLAVYAAVAFSMPWFCCFLSSLPECDGIACDALGFIPPVL